MSIVCEYCNNLPASACSPNHVEVVARLRRGLWVDSLHELLEDNKRGQAADPAAIEREEAEVLVWHRWGAKGLSVNIGMRSWLSSWEVEVGSRLALTSTQLNGVLAAMQASSCICLLRSRS